MNQTPLQELRETSNSMDFPKMWTVMMDREVVRDNDIVRETEMHRSATELQASLNTRQEIIIEAAIYKNTKMKKSVAFFREQQDQDLKFIRDILSKISKTQHLKYRKLRGVTSETSELNPEDVTARLEDLEVEIDTLHADTEDKELLISELQDSLAAAENEIAMLQIRVADAEDRRAEDHDQIQKILARLGL
ncbi:hypothetical protein Tco_0706150 [Tanacetum coccineum]|uniref:Uncharacterized protein n=1 Tax=Tanacetum coccineum TaxID=301880 RepID=A0ABQ4Y6N1_9ASTR